MNNFSFETMIFTSVDQVNEKWPQAAGDERKESAIYRLQEGSNGVLLQKMGEDVYMLTIPPADVMQQILDSQTIGCPGCGAKDGFIMETRSLTLATGFSVINNKGDVEGDPVVKKDTTEFLSVLVCPNCNANFNLKLEDGKSLTGRCIVPPTNRPVVAVVDAALTLLEGGSSDTLQTNNWIDYQVNFEDDEDDYEDYESDLDGLDDEDDVETW